MSQQGKVKFYRTMKVLFYCLGIPLFVFATFVASITFIGENPYGGPGVDGLFNAVFGPMGSPYLYGVYIAIGVGLAISLVHIILHVFMKNNRARLFAGVAIGVVFMLVPVFVMDAFYLNKIEAMQIEAEETGSGVVIKSYEDYLSYYKKYSSAGAPTFKGGNLSEDLTDRYNDFIKVYNIKGGDGAGNGGYAGNTSNRPIYYDELGIDFDGNGIVEAEVRAQLTSKTDFNDHILVRVAPTGAEMDKEGNPVGGTGYLEIDGQKFDRFEWRSAGGTVEGEAYKTYFWYAKDKNAEMKDGKYGMASYSDNGMLSDGYVFGINVAMNILEDYYVSQDTISSLGGDDTKYSDIITAAQQRQQDYYTSSPDLELLWNSELALAPDYTITNGELNELLGYLVGAIGSNQLFDELFSVLDSVFTPTGTGFEVGINTVLGLLGTFGVDASSITPILKTLNLYCSETDYKQEVYREDKGLAAGATLTDAQKAEAEALVLTTAQQAELDGRNFKLVISKEKMADYGEVDEYPVERTYVRIGLVNGMFGSPGFFWNLDTNASLDNIIALITTIADGALDAFGVDIGLDIEDLLYKLVGIVLPLVGIDVGDAPITSVNDILLGLLGGMYWHQSPVIKPIYDFYLDPSLDPNSDEAKLAMAYADYDRALFEGSVRGKGLASTLIGDSIGSGNFSSKNAYSLSQIRQLRADLSFMPEMFPTLVARDMMMMFAGVVALMTTISFVFAEKQHEWETGTNPPIKKRKKRDKKQKADKSKKKNQNLEIEEGVL